MEHLQEEKRRALRYALPARVAVRRATGETIAASAVNISSSGMLLEVGQPFSFQLGEEVAVEVELPDHPDQPLSHWGLAKVVRLDGFRSAIQLSAGSFDPLPNSHAPGESTCP
jgi:PilZ domain